MDVKRKTLLPLLLTLCHLNSCHALNNERQKSGKAFAIYKSVEIKEQPCQSFLPVGSFGYRNGTCMILSDCQQKGGMPSGNCASGFGTCCVFLVNGLDGSQTASTNCSYIQNPDFPAATTYGGNYEYNIPTSSYKDICQIRLDFEAFSLFGTGVSDESRGCETDYMNVRTSGGLSLVPTICGENAGQHIYFSVDGSTTLLINIQSSSALWDIKVSLIQCTSPMIPPDGCLQYLTGLTGRIETFNFANALESHLFYQDYSVCIRPDAGFCCVHYRTCSDITSGDAFSLCTSDFGPGARNDDECITTDHVEIPNSASQCFLKTNLAFNHKYCGSFFSSSQASFSNTPVCTCSPPFLVHIHTDGLNDFGENVKGTTRTEGTRTTITNTKLSEGTKVSRGLCLEYKQIAC